MVRIPPPDGASTGRPPGYHDVTCALLVGAALLDAAFPAIVTSLDATAPDLDPWRHTLSRHAQAPGFPWMEVAFLAHGLAMCLLAVALRRLPPRSWGAVTALWLGGGASLLLAVFAADEGDAETTRGALHQSFAPVAFLGVTVAGVLSWHVQRGSMAWRGLWFVPGVFAAVLVIWLSLFGLLLAIVQFTDGPRIILGVMERLVIVGIAGWVLAESVQGCRVAKRVAHDAGVADGNNSGPRRWQGRP